MTVRINIWGTAATLITGAVVAGGVATYQANQRDPVEYPDWTFQVAAADPLTDAERDQIINAINAADTEDAAIAIAHDAANAMWAQERRLLVIMPTSQHDGFTYQLVGGDKELWSGSLFYDLEDGLTDAESIRAGREREHSTDTVVVTATS